ncbi:DUF3300 domain-containing protein [Alishewanella tabrizica]|uniref:DUF3300 domain-containing protein n=1 Tax=Alishewanella tabrizica TaxID=671278 RepID=A0ABQ2WEW0_9ALTE|nr:DUF3300 domain-containing protein [Alishewanella tabrizica]GGW52795.1 hypothetical protein GCM10008111_06090 [Alishewanella tabrizica]
MQVFRALPQLFLVTLLLLLSGCSSAKPHQTTVTNTQAAELDQMLAPIALYPDSVLTHVLIAATYPLEIVQAARWLEQNPGLSGEAAVAAASDQDWDPSVQALVAFPQLLQRLNDDLIWTQQLGEAFISNEPALLASIQRLRQRAYAQGSLNKMEHVVVEREREIIVIEPARREVIYVPYYDTRVVYGNWWWPSYPPVHWYEPVGYRNNVTFYWGSGFNIRPSFYFSIFDWQRRHVVVHHHYHYTPPRYYPKRQHFHHASRWQHDHYHRRGVHYQHRELRDRHDFYDSRPEHRRHAQQDRSKAPRDRQYAEERANELRTDNRLVPADSRLRQNPQRRDERDAYAQRQQREAERLERETQRQDRDMQRQQREAQFSQRQQAQRQRAEGRANQTSPAATPVSEASFVSRRIERRERQAQHTEREQQTQPITTPESTVQSQQRVQQRSPQSNRPQYEQRRQLSQRTEAEQRPQPITPPQSEQRSLQISRPQPESGAQSTQRPQREQRVQPSSQQPVQSRVQQISRPQQEPQIPRQDVSRPSRIERPQRIEQF